MHISPRYAIALVACAGLFPVALDSTVVNVAIVPIAKALHSSVDTIQWIYIGYLLANAAVTPLGGYLGNRFGVKRLFIGGMAFFTFCSFLCGLAPNESLLVALRVLQGIGGGLLLPLGMAIAMQPFAKEERARAMAVVAVPLLLAPVLGPIIGGLVIDGFGWQSIFFINVPIGLIVIPLAWRVLARDARVAELEDAPSSLDSPGLLLSMSGVALLVYACKRVSQTDPSTISAANPQGTIYGWGNLPIWLMIVAALALLCLFTYQALRISKDPVLDLRLFARLDFAVANLTIWISVIMMFGVMFLVPVFLQQVRQPGLSPLHTGLALLPMGLATVVGMILAGGVYKLVGARPLVLAGTALLALGCWQLKSMTPGMSIAQLSWPLALVGLSTTLIMLPTQTLALQALTGAALNKATSLVNAAKLLWGSIGSAVMVTLYIQHTTDHATRLAAALPRALLAQPGTLARLSAQAATSGMVDVFTYLLWGAPVVLVLALFLPGGRVDSGTAGEMSRESADMRQPIPA